MLLFLSQIGLDSLIFQSLFEQSLQISIYIRNEPTFRGFLDLTLAGSTEILDELSERGPLDQVHLDVVAIVDVLVVNDGSGDATEPVATLHVVQESAFEFFEVFLLYKFHGFIIWYEINKCHGFKINNHKFPWAFIR